MTGPPTLALSDLLARVGQEIGVSRWFTVDQARIDAFAEVTEDRQFIHVDPTAAAAGPFGGTIAHGFLTLSLLAAMSQDALPRIEGATAGVNYGFSSLRFLAPVRSGVRLRARFTLISAEQRSLGAWLLKHGVVVEIDGEAKPALAAEWLFIRMIPGSDGG